MAATDSQGFTPSPWPLTLSLAGEKANRNAAWRWGQYYLQEVVCSGWLRVGSRLGQVHGGTRDPRHK